MNSILLSLLIVVSQTDPSSLIHQAELALRQGDYDNALTFSQRAVKAEPGEAGHLLLRGRVYEGKREFDKAASDYTKAIGLDPKLAAAWVKRGEVNFRRGKIAESISDFDRYLSLAPEQKPYLWQRGIALYYAGKYKEGKEQFEVHQTVNPHDVENAVWHFLCTAKLEGLQAARKQLIPIEGDTRIPMKEIHRLFARKGTVEEVRLVAEASYRPENQAPLFYSHLYLGLYYEATGDMKQAVGFLDTAAKRAKENGYMGDVARVHPALKSKRK